MRPSSAGLGTFTIGTAPRWIAALLACLITGSSPSVAAALDGPNRLTLLHNLRDGAYESLELKLSQWQDAYESDANAEAVVVVAFRSFASSDPTLEQSLHEWIERQPRSFAARLVRGIYYRHLAELSRGPEARDVTPPQRLEEMDRYDLLASADFEAALALRPRAVAAHAGLIAIAVDHADGTLLERRVTDAASVLGAGSSRAVCTAYMGNFDRRQGGSTTALAAFMATPPYHAVCGSLNGHYFVEMSAGEAAREARDVIAAIDHLTLAASLGESRAPRLARGRTFYGNGWWVGAIVEFDRLIADDLNDADALFWRGLSKWRSGRAEDALTDLDAAIALDPFHPKFLSARGELLAEQNRPSEAAVDLENATRFGEYDETIQDSRALILMTRLRDFQRAAEAYDRLVQLAPENSRYWRDYTMVLTTLRDCRALAAATSYRALCPQQDGCQAGLEDSFYTDVLEQLRVEKNCPPAE